MAVNIFRGIYQGSNPRVCIGAVMRLERRYIVEWVAWHRFLGFEIWIADHGGPDGQSELVRKLAAANLIRRFDVRGYSIPPQIPAYNAMFSAAIDEQVPYIGFMDADEFFEPIENFASDSGANLVRATFARTKAAALGLNWMCFGSSTATDDPAAPVLERFQRAAPMEFNVNRHIKSFFDVKKCSKLLRKATFCELMNPHGLRFDEKNYTHDGAPLHFSDTFGLTKDVRWRNARIRHYCVKTWNEFIEGKVSRGCVDKVKNHYDSAFFKRHDRNDIFAPLHTSTIEELRKQMALVDSAIAGVTVDNSSDCNDLARITCALEEFLDSVGPDRGDERELIRKNLRRLQKRIIISSSGARLRRLIARRRADLLESHVPDLVAELQHYRRIARTRQLRISEIKKTLSYRITAPMRLVGRMANSLRKRSLRQNIAKLRGSFGPIGQLENIPSLSRDVSRPQLDDKYAEWIRQFDTLNDLDKDQINSQLSSMTNQPLVSIIILGENSRLERTIRSIRSQLYKEIEIVLFGPEKAADITGLVSGLNVQVLRHSSDFTTADRFNIALRSCSGEIVLCIDAGDVLAETAAYLAAWEKHCCPDAGVIYFDHDELTRDGKGRQNPFFKSDWNRELARHSQSYPGRSTFYSRMLLIRLGGAKDVDRWQSDLVQRAERLLGPGCIRHVPFIGLHEDSSARSPASFSIALPAKKETDADLPPWQAGRAAFPPVTIIVPTRDKVGLLRRCLAGMLHRTNYPDFNIMVIDNQSAEKDTFDYFHQLKCDSRIQIVNDDAPFNFSALHNSVVSRASGEVIAFVNNDIDVIDPEWLKEMVSYAIQPDVGAVGAKLLYGNNTIQHAGVIVGTGGGADHIFRGLARNDPGPWKLANLPQEYSAVTAACMVLRKQLYWEVGGFDENMKIEFQDTDLCLKLGKAGYRNIYNPRALLYHLEMQTRGIPEADRSDLKYFQARWPEIISKDPYYNPNLTLDGLDRTPAFPSRVVPPWRNDAPAIAKANGR